MIRLDSDWPDIVKQLQKATPNTLRAVSIAAVRFAISITNVTEAMVNDALASLEIDGSLSSQRRIDLDKLVDKLDMEYFQIQKAAEQGQASYDDYMKLFNQARAVAALSFAGREDPYEAATESIYEAKATTSHPNDLLHIIEQVINR